MSSWTSAPRRGARLITALGASLLGVALLAGCGPDRAVGTSAPASVTMRLIAYRPDRLQVEAGTTVTWSMKDAGVHTVTSGTVAQQPAGVEPRPDGRFDSGQIRADGQFSFRFDRPGTYPYFCSVHPATMRGEVRVV